MRIGPVSTPSTQALPDILTDVLPNVQPKQASTPIHEQEFSSSPDTANRSPRVKSTTDHDHDAASAVPHSEVDEDEYTIWAYGDISLSDVMVLPPPDPTHPDPLKPRHPQPRLRLKLRRPPMPRRQSSHIRVPDPLPHNEGMDSDERWPGNPRSFANNSPWTPHQLLQLSPLPATSYTQGSKPAKKDSSSLERIFDELIPSSPSIRLSPPGSPANQAFSMPQETRSVHDGPPSLPQLGKPQEAPWRQRLPPRLPIPNWDA